MIGTRPIVAVATPDGGMDIQAYDWTTGAFVRHLSYLTRVTFPDGEAEVVSADVFARRVAELRGAIARPLGADKWLVSDVLAGAVDESTDPAVFEDDLLLFAVRRLEEGGLDWLRHVLSSARPERRDLVLMNLGPKGRSALAEFFPDGSRP